MPAVGGAQRQVPHPAAEDRHRRVGDRQAHRQDREEDRDRRGPLAHPLHADDPDQEADQKAAAVAQEDAGGVPVVEQEAREAPGQSRRHDRHADVVVRDRHQRERAADQQADAGGQAVHPVDQVPDVHAPQEPEQRDGQGRQPDGDRPPRDGELQPRPVQVGGQPEQLEPGDPHAPGEQDQDGERLAGELHPRAHGAGVVDEPDHQDDRGGDEHRGLVRPPLGEPGPAGQVAAEPDHGDPRRHAEGEPEAAEPRRGPLVDAAELVGPVDRAGPDGDPRHHRGRQHAPHEGDGEDQQERVRDHHGSDRPQRPGGVSADDPAPAPAGQAPAATR